MNRTQRELDAETFAGIYTSEKFRNQVATAHWQCDSQGNKKFRITCSYPVTWIVTDEQIAEAQAERARAKAQAIADSAGKLVFVGMGMTYDERYEGDVCNWRIRTNIRNPEGRNFFIEIMTRADKETMWVDFSVDRDEQKRLEARHGASAPQTYYNFGGIERGGAGRKYTLQNVLELVNKTYKCNFSEIVIDNYNLTTDDYTSESPGFDWVRIAKANDYRVWRRQGDDGRYVYNVTTTHEPPTTPGGYYDVNYIKRIKGINF